MKKKDKKEKKNIYYVYVYLDPRKTGKHVYDNLEFDYEPFYIGEGHKSRAYHHIKSWSRSNKENKRIIKEIKEETGLDPIIKFIKLNLFEDKAIKLEIKCIAKVGRKDLGKGPLTNKTNGGDGTSGLIISEKRKELISQLNSKPIIQFDLHGNFVKEFHNIKQAAIHIKTDRTSITCALTKKGKTAGKSIWFYKSDFKKNRIPKKLNQKIVKELTTSEAEKFKKRVVKFSLKGKFIKIFNSIEDAAKDAKVCRDSIRVVCKDQNKEDHKTAGALRGFLKQILKILMFLKN